MQDRINKVVPGTGIRASWGNDVIDQLRRLKLIPGNGIKISTSSKGTRIDLDLPQESSSGESSVTGPVIPLYLTSYHSGGAYKGATFKVAGTNETNVDGENTIYFPYICPSTTLPLGCTVLAAKVESHVIASSSDNAGGQ